MAQNIGLCIFAAGLVKETAQNLAHLQHNALRKKKEKENLCV